MGFIGVKLRLNIILIGMLYCDIGKFMNRTINRRILLIEYCLHEKTLQLI